LCYDGGYTPNKPSVCDVMKKNGKTAVLNEDW
jgi:hypothetical protein